MVRPKLTGLPMHSRAIWTNLRASVGFQSGKQDSKDWPANILQT